MTVVLVVRGFPYSADGINSVIAEAGAHLDVRPALVPGLVSAGLVRLAGGTADPPLPADPPSELVEPEPMSVATDGLLVPDVPRPKPRRFTPRGTS